MAPLLAFLADTPKSALEQNPVPFTICAAVVVAVLLHIALGGGRIVTGSIGYALWGSPLSLLVIAAAAGALLWFNVGVVLGVDATTAHVIAVAAAVGAWLVMTLRLLSSRRRRKWRIKPLRDQPIPPMASTSAINRRPPGE